MQSEAIGAHHEPTRAEALLFFLKTRVFIARRWWQERNQTVPLHPDGKLLRAAPRIAETRAALWTQVAPAEFPLTAGKVQNLRAACRRLNGIEVPADAMFSFWKQLGRTTREAGFTVGRELRSGCVIPNMGGGLCQLSGLLHAAALEAGLEVVEKHEHSQVLPGAPLPPERDATVFWNYVDLRFRAPFAWRIEARLSATELVIAIRANDAPAMPRIAKTPLAVIGKPTRATAEGDCLTCNVTSCFRHPSAIRENAPAMGHTAWLLDGVWPEFNDWCQRHSHAGDHWLTPLDGVRWKKANYAWAPPVGVKVWHATLETLGRSLQQRRLPMQGAVRQKFLLDAQRQLADRFARHIDPQARHLVISQTLLPHLWLAGHFGGRTFDVLMNRWPMAVLQSKLDAAAERHPESPTLADFRADPELVAAETAALAAAARLVTPHRAIARSFGERAILLDWKLPQVQEVARQDLATPRWFFPASALGRKGIYEVAAAMRETGGELCVLGRANEGGANPLSEIQTRQASANDLTECTAVVIPAWVEHEPRLALKALAAGIPVIASKDCGLMRHPLLIEVEAGDVDALVNAMREMTTVEIALISA